MCPKCYQAGCEDGDCMEYVIVKKTFALEIPKHKYSQLKQDLGVKRLFHLTDDLIQITNKLERMSEQIIIEDIEIDDGEY
ncbi:hypothetical protein [Rossellomorea aquimaris]|uniref:hypothetical protein n=1 Tax=Rossellomorea aquimaris TaxID=189382 RepID=UPI0011E91B78|nr:hypothetical protein [Rossellomorea aquimaris]TYS91944.1 hypothetical protein FZC88_07355 [Rossellomorea aquimaris]